MTRASCEGVLPLSVRACLAFTDLRNAAKREKSSVPGAETMSFGACEGRMPEAARSRG